MKLTYNNRPIEIKEYEYEPSEYIEVIHAVYLDTGTDLTEKELEDLLDKHFSELEEEFHDNLVCAYEAHADSLRER